MKPLRIYIAGPYSAPTDAEKLGNTTRAIDAGIELLGKGHWPFIPHLTHFVDKRAEEIGVELTWEDYIEWDQQFLVACDALLHLGSSRGADLERDEAESLGIEIFDDITEIPAASE